MKMEFHVYNISLPSKLGLARGTISPDLYLKTSVE